MINFCIDELQKRDMYRLYLRCEIEICISNMNLKILIAKYTISLF